MSRLGKKPIDIPELRVDRKFEVPSAKLPGKSSLPMLKLAPALPEMSVGYLMP